MTARFLPEAARRPRRFWLRSLTSKLVTGVVALILILVAATGTSTFYFLRSNLLNRLDQQVAAAAEQNAPFVERCLIRVGMSGNARSECSNNGPPQTVHEWVAVLSDSGGIPAEIKGTNVTTLQLSASEIAEFVADPGRTVTLHQNGNDLHVTARRSNSLPIVVVTGLSTDDVDQTLGRLIRLEVILGAAAIALAMLATTWGVQRSLRNLYKVTGTARDVTAELSPEGAGLDRRVPVVEEGTEVGQLAESVNTLLSAVEMQFAARLESEQRMRQFLADASHELRTPLTSIRGYAELARMQRAAGDSAEDNLHRIESEGTRMSRLVEDLLIIARGDAVSEAQPVLRDPIDVAAMLDDAVSGARVSFPARQIDLQVVPVPTVHGDRDQLLRVVRNLVTNACVHTREDLPILVRCYPDNSGVTVQVIDGGPGLPPEDAAHVFERFWRADKARTRARGGSGLGLSIVGTLVRAHGGAVAFDSTVEHGSTVSVWLPAAPAESGVDA